MRIRQIKPAYWVDARLQKELTAAIREFYIGLWMLADDAGWFRWDVDEVAAELYRYQPTNKREGNVRRHMAKLVELRRVEIGSCGHGHIPTMTTHQRFSGATKRVYTIRDEHTNRCSHGSTPREPAGIPGQSPMPARNGRYLDSDGTVSDPAEDDPRAEARRLLANPASPEHVKRAARRALVTSDSDGE